VNKIADEISGLLSLEPLQAIEANPKNLREMLQHVVRENPLYARQYFLIMI